MGLTVSRADTKVWLEPRVHTRGEWVHWVGRQGLRGVMEPEGCMRALMVLRGRWGQVECKWNDQGRVLVVPVAVDFLVLVPCRGPR